MTDFVLTHSILQVIRNLAGRADRSLIAQAVGCPVHKLEQLCREQCISLEFDVEETRGVR